MSVLSTLKDNLYGRTWSFPYNCYEIGHGWTPNCSDAALGIGVAAFKNSLPLYTSLYLFTQLGLQRKYSFEAFYETFKSIITSSSFLSFNFLGGIGVSCILRNNSDRYYYRIQCFLPGFIASYMALLIERPSRRPALAFYLANMSTELLYKIAESRGCMISLKHGETILFSLGMACWLHFVRVHGFGHDPVSTAVKYMIGPLEAKSRRKAIKQTSNDQNQELLEVVPKKEKRKSKIDRIEESITKFFNIFFGIHPACPHKGMSCFDYSVTPTFTRFLMGYGLRSVLNLGVAPTLLLEQPGQALKNAFIAKSSLKFGLFLGTFAGSSKAMYCLLRRIHGRQENWHSIVAGGFSGLSMLFSPKSTLSTYVIWKCFEQYFFLGVQNGHIKHPNQVICLLYAASVNVLLYTFALEPKFIRPSYMKFIDKISDHKLHQVNRIGK